MNNVQEKLRDLREKGWTSAAIADELGVTDITVYRWKSGRRSPENAKPVMVVLDQLLKRKRIPKRKRYKTMEV